MARIPVGDKYHIAINGIGYIVRGLNYQKKDSRVFAPRFGTGEVGENDLGILKVLTQNDYSGGSFQDQLVDSTKYKILKNAVKNNVDSLLYPSPDSVSATIPVGTRTGVGKCVMFRGDLYCIGNGTGVGALLKYTPSTKTFAAQKSDFGMNITDIVVWQDNLYVAVGGGGDLWKWTGSAWSQIAGWRFTKLLVFNGKFYCSGISTNSENGALWSFDGSVGTKVGDVGDKNKQINCFIEFNHRLYIGKADGLYAYDGVQISCIYDQVNDYDLFNFWQMDVFNGALYAIVKNSIVKFNGSTFETIKTFDQYETVNALRSLYGRLWIGTLTNVTATGKETAADAYVYYYDGIGFYCYDCTINTGNSGAMPYDFAYVNSGGYKHLLFFISGVSGVQDNQIYVVDLNKEFLAGASNPLGIYSSRFNAGFPSINKHFESFEVLSKNLGASDSIVVEFRTYDGSVWTAWQTLGTITTSTSNRLSIFKTAFSPVFKDIEFITTLNRANASNACLRGQVVRYYLSPDYKREWQLSLLCIGKADNPLLLLDGSPETNYSSTLRENLYSSRNSVNPVGFLDIDYSLLNGSHNNSVTTFTLSTTELLPASGFAMVDEELISYTGKTATQLTGCVRGVLGTSAAVHSDKAIISPYYRVIVSDIVQEEVYFSVDSLKPSVPVLTVLPETVITLTLKEI